MINSQMQKTHFTIKITNDKNKDPLKLIGIDSKIYHNLI